MSAKLYCHDSAVSRAYIPCNSPVLLAFFALLPFSRSNFNYPLAYTLSRIFAKTYPQTHSSQLFWRPKCSITVLCFFCLRMCVLHTPYVASPPFDVLWLWGWPSTHLLRGAWSAAVRKKELRFQFHHWVPIAINVDPRPNTRWSKLLSSLRIIPDV